MKKDYKFSELVYEATDFEVARKEIEEAIAQVASAATLEDILLAIDKYDSVGENADKYRYAHFCTALMEVVYFCESHEFETYTLSNKGISFDELTAKARELNNLYWLKLDGSELEHFYNEGIDVLKNMLLYMFPCYGIGYALSWICAMQFYERFCQNKEKTVKEYNEFCKLGGSLSYPELLKTIGMEPSYKKGTVEKFVNFARRELEKLEEMIG